MRRRSWRQTLSELGLSEPPDKKPAPPTAAIASLPRFESRATRRPQYPLHVYRPREITTKDAEPPPATLPPRTQPRSGQLRPLRRQTYKRACGKIVGAEARPMPKKKPSITDRSRTVTELHERAQKI